MKITVLVIVLLMGLGIPAVKAQNAVQPMLGWKMEENKGRYVFKPTAVFSDENKEFSYEVMPLEKADGRSFDEWFTGSIDKNMRVSGFTVPRKDKKNISYSTLSSYSGKVTDKNGHIWYVAYMAYRTSGQQYRLAKLFSSPDITYYTNCMKSAAMHFGKLAKQEGAFETSGMVEMARTNALPQPPASVTFEKVPVPRNTVPNVDNLAAVPVKGLKPTEIKGIVINLEYSYGVGGAVVSEYTPYLLLNDGSLYSNPVVSPYEFDAALSKQREPKKWGSWKINGGAITVTWPGRNKSEKWEKTWFWARPAAGNEKIEGAFTSISGAGNTAMGGNVMTVSSKNILFNTLGRFALTSVAVGTNYTDYGISTSAYSKKDEAGAYALNGYSIELRFNNGSTMRRAFYFYPKDKQHFGIGNHVYIQKR